MEEEPRMVVEHRHVRVRLDGEVVAFCLKTDDGKEQWFAMPFTSVSGFVGVLETMALEAEKRRGPPPAPGQSHIAYGRIVTGWLISVAQDGQGLAIAFQTDTPVQPTVLIPARAVTRLCSELQQAAGLLSGPTKRKKH